MDRSIRVKTVKKKVEDINAKYPHEVLALGGIGRQWERGNGSLKRTNVDIATLAINIRSSYFLVGCDGVRSGINNYLKETLPFNSKNSQNERYRCEDSEIRRVIEYYANVRI